MAYLAQDPYEQQEADSDAFNSKCRTIAEHLLNFEFDEIEEKTGQCFAEWMLEREGENETIEPMHSQLISLILRRSDWNTHVLELATDFLEFVDG